MSLEREALAVWLASLNEGDEVAVNTSRYATTSYATGRFVRRTAKRVVIQIWKDKPPVGFNAITGREIGGDPYHAMRVEPMTPEILSLRRRNRILAGLKTVQWDFLTTEQLDEVWVLVRHTAEVTK